MTAPAITYVPRSTCQSHLDPLNVIGDRQRERVVPVGSVEICEDCGRVWTAVQFIFFSGIVQTAWVCYRRGSVPDPMVAVLARLDALEAANTAASATITALTSRVAALEAKTVSVRRALPASTAVIAVGGTQILTITWKTAFPDANYVIEALPVQALVGKVAPTVTSKTASGCVISVTSTVLVALGTALLDVTAVRYAA